MIERKETNKIIIHCSDGVDCEENHPDTVGHGDVDSIRKFHTDKPPQGRGWEDIGYHFVIDYLGIIEIGRAENLVGSHCEGENHDSIGICLVGKTDFTPAQIEQLKFLVNSLINKYGLVSDNVFGHYEFASAVKQGKTCPNLKGDYLRNLIKGVSV